METPIAAPPTEPIPGRLPPKRPIRNALAIMVGLVVLCGLMLIALRLTRQGALPGVTLSDVELGGLEGSGLRDTVARVAEDSAAITLTVTRGPERVTTTAAELGYAIDVDRTVEAVLARGRQANPVAALADHIRSFAGTILVLPIQDVDDQRVDRWAVSAATDLSSPAIEGTVRFEGATAVRVDPQPGVRVLPEHLGEMARAALREGRDAELAAPSEPTAPRTSAADVDVLFAQAARAVSAPVTLSRGETALELTPGEIGTILRVEPGSEGGPALQLVADPAAVERVVDPARRASFEAEPVNARFSVAGGSVSISESGPGFRFDPVATARQVLELATRNGLREDELAGEVLQPSLTTEEARTLNITQQVSTFTTNHACCQGRVTNIHRIADLVDEAVIMPGETFSLNSHVGPRTPEKGFVEGGAIQHGEFVDEVGGGVSQFTTTMFNAAYFGGYDIIEHKPHSYYISRYPEGREATLNYPTVDLKFKNDSPHGILVQTSYSGTAITVSFWSTRWVTVESATGPRTNPTTADAIYRENDELPPGTEKVLQEGGRPGFDVVVTRVLRFPDGRAEQEQFRTTYLAEPRIVERNT